MTVLEFRGEDHAKLKKLANIEEKITIEANDLREDFLHDVSDMKNVLEAKDRKKAGMTVSPYGLTLMEVTY